MKNTHNPTMMIKSKFSNLVHKLIDYTYGCKRHSREFYEANRNRHNNPLTIEQKAELYDEIVKIHNECSEELRNYQYDRRLKNRVKKEREKRALILQ